MALKRMFMMSALAVSALTAATVSAQTLKVGGEQFFRVDWQASESKDRTKVSGHVLNDWGFSAVDVRLLVEGLAASGQVVHTTIAYVPGEVTPGSRAYFETRVPHRAPTYRVSVIQYDWLQTGGG